MTSADMISMELQTFIEIEFEKLKQEIAEAFTELQHQQNWPTHRLRLNNRRCAPQTRCATQRVTCATP